MLADQLRAALAETHVPSEDELTKRIQGYEKAGKPITPELARRMAQKTIQRIKDPRTRKKAAGALKDARSSYKAELASGKKHAGLLKRVKPDPSRDVGPFRDAFKTVKGQESVDRIATGRSIPDGWWHPFKPVEIVVPSEGEPYIHDGNHRLKAAKAAGAKLVRVKVYKGTLSGPTEVVILPL